MWKVIITSSYTMYIQPAAVIHYLVIFQKLKRVQFVQCMERRPPRKTQELQEMIPESGLEQ